ncbi:unnamed protein product, partial [Thlaspi arvense]
CIIRSRRLPLVKVEEIAQTIDSHNFTAHNSILFSGPLATTSFSTSAKFEVRSPKHFQFEEGIVGIPQLIDSVVLLERRIDLTPFKGIISSLQDTASYVVKTTSNQPPLKFNIPNDTNAELWLLTRYLDEELWISGGDVGSIFILIKRGS